MRMHILLAAIVFLGIIIFWGVYVLFLAEGGEGKEKRATATVRGIEFEVEVRDTMLGRAQGLSGREGLGENEGMLFLFGMPGMHGFWMKDMLFSIDIVWVRDGRIVGFEERVPPPAPGTSQFALPQYLPPHAVDTVLEVNAGTVERHNFEVGDEVAVERSA